MYWFIGGGVKNSTDIMIETIAVIMTVFTCLKSCNSSSGDVFLDWDGCWGMCIMWAFLYKRLFLGVSSFLKRLITHLSWMLKEVEEETGVLKVLVALEAILEVVMKDLEISFLSFLIWVLLYCRNVVSLSLKIMFSGFVKVGSSSFCCRDVLV